MVILGSLARSQHSELIPLQSVVPCVSKLHLQAMLRAINLCTGNWNENLFICGCLIFKSSVPFAPGDVDRGVRSRMTGSTYRKSRVISSVICSVDPVRKRGRCLALCAVLASVNLPGFAFSQPPCPGIHVQILDIRNSTGTVACALFESPEGFPTDFLRSATNIMMMKIRDTQARCDFLDIPPGAYALAVIHDENMDGKLATNWLGVPKEGYGFSNNAKASSGPPSFEAASFSYDGHNLDMTIRLNY